MRRIIAITVMVIMASMASAQKCKVLNQETGFIRFEVDENLPKPEKDFYFYDSAEQQARNLISSSVPYGYNTEILACSFAGEKMALMREDVFFNALVEAYADHRPFVLSPDAVWQLISFNFSEYVNNHSEEMRSLLVPHEGVKELKIMTEENILGDKNADWSDIFEKFSVAIAENTKGDIAQLMTSVIFEALPFMYGWQAAAGSLFFNMIQGIAAVVIFVPVTSIPAVKKNSVI